MSDLYPDPIDGLNVPADPDELEHWDADDHAAIQAAERARDRAEARLAYLEQPAWRRALARWRTRRSQTRSTRRTPGTTRED